MKLRSLLFLFFSIFLAGILKAQVVCEYPEGVITSLVLTEVRMTSTVEGYIELTNMGEQPVNLSKFKIGRLNAWSESTGIKDLCNDPWYAEVSHGYLFLPDRLLNPGESYVITNAYDYSPVHYKEGLGRLGGWERRKQIGIYEVADKLIHMAEPINGIYYERDSVTTAYNDPEQLTRRGYYENLFYRLTAGTIYLEHHYMEGDSAVVDQIGGVFDTGGGRNLMHRTYGFAGIEEGLGNSIAVRKAFIKNGNVDFANARGVSLEDSDWIPLPLSPGTDSWRDVFWTIGNHGNYELTENTLESKSEAITVDFAAKKIMVPWGTRRLDDIMRNMKKKPGVAWQYNLNPLKEDSLYRSARNGDMLTIHVVGNTRQSANFYIEVKDPTADDNIVVPVDRPILRLPSEYGPVTTRTQNGILSWPRVTRHESGVDTITGSAYGLPFDLRTDSLLKYLEKPPRADWEFVWVDGVKRPDLKNGDKLIITSENGKVKEYFIQVQDFWPNTNTDLLAITWPDIPDFYRGAFGWKGDTIPNFSPGTTNYQVTVPVDVEGIPALKAKTSHVNASVKVTRARSLNGSLEDRTITFEVTAEDDTIHKTYKVELMKEKLPNEIEPYRADPFFSEFVNIYPTNNSYLEIYNPGNQPLDLRNYLIGGRGQSEGLYAPILHNPRWTRRYTVYIPGLKHIDNVTYNSISNRDDRKIMVPDPNVNPIIPPGGTFVLSGTQRREDYFPGITPFLPRIDVELRNFPDRGIFNTWDEETDANSQEGSPFPINGNRLNVTILYKILNDSIKLGLKSIKDPNDFEVIDAWGMPDYGYWVIGGYAMDRNEVGNIFRRKPHISQGNPELGGSFGTNEEDCEWIRIQPDVEYSHLPTSDYTRYIVALSDVGNHYMIEPTYYKSTVNSSVYKVSNGFGPDESILGLKTGTTVAEFLSLINREHEGQDLKVVAAADGSELAQSAIIGLNDKLIVVSADKSNTTYYRLDVTGTGLSSDAYLTSNRWNITVEVAPKSAGEAGSENDGIGSVTGFDYGTTLLTIVENIKVPDGATLTIIDKNGAYVPFKILNFDMSYGNVTVNPDIYLDVVAEDATTRIVYQLQPSTSASDAFILSDVYSVSQLDNLINYVPRGTNFQAFLANIIPSLGATLKLVDKMGFERVFGNIREDDKVVVTSANGQVTRVYFISFLPTEIIPATTYLAYVLSNAYSVNQVEYVIAEGLAPLTGQTRLSEFLSFISPSMGAAIAVIDKNGNEKSTGDLDDGDMLKVTSADGKIVVMYHLDLELTSTDRRVIQQQIEIYPNPTAGRLNINGVEAGNTIQIFSATGALILNMKARSSLETLSIDEVPSGPFIIVISNENNVLARFKAIKFHSR